VGGILLFGPPGTGKTLLAKVRGRWLRWAQNCNVGGAQLLRTALDALFMHICSKISDEVLNMVL